MKGKLLILTRCSNPHGGADRIIVDLCQELPKQGWEVKLGLTQGKTYNRPDRYLEVYPIRVPTIAVNGEVGTHYARVHAIKEIILREKPDIVLSIRVADAYEAVYLTKPLLPNLRLVTGIRAYETPYLVDLLMYHQIVDYVVTSGELIRHACIDLCDYEKKRIVSIGGGIHKPQNVITPRKIGANVVKLLYVGRLDQEQKRALDLIPFIEELKSRGIKFELDIAGIGSDEGELMEHFGADISLGIIRFHGWLSRAALYEQLYSKCDIFIHFAAWEGMTISPREAMVHGMVPVISKFPGCIVEAQFRHEKNALLFEVGQTREAAMAVIRLIDDHALYNRLSNEAMNSQSGKYEFHGSINAWGECFEECITLSQKYSSNLLFKEKCYGVFGRLGISSYYEHLVRTILCKDVQHQNAGSEWPTHRSKITEADCKKFSDYAQQLDQQYS